MKQPRLLLILVVGLSGGQASFADAPTYHRDVAPLLRRHCAACHRAGGNGPFALADYRQAARWAANIKERVADRRMPPWLPADGVSLRGARRLNDAEIATLTAWADAGAPEGAWQEAPAVHESAPARSPDLVLAPHDTFHLGATGPDIFRCFPMVTGVTEDRWIVGYDIRPGEPRVVHHVVKFVDTIGAARKLELGQRDESTDRGAGYTAAMGAGFVPGNESGLVALGGWAPGQGTQFLPAGAGYRLPARAELVLQVHYHRDGRPATDRTRVGLYFARDPIVQPWQTIPVSGLRRFQFLPAGEPHIVARGTTLVQTDCLLHSIMPHMHLLGRSIKVTRTSPGGRPELLLDVPRWDYRWQESYWFEEPIRVTAGTTLAIEGVFDNSAANPSNPNRPPRLVLYGTQATDEMLYAYFGATSVRRPWEPIRFLQGLPRVEVTSTPPFENDR